MNYNKLIYVLLVFCSWTSATLQAQEAVQSVKFEEAGLETLAPASWQLLEEEGAMELHSPSKAILITFMDFPEGELEPVLAGIDEMMEQSIQDLQTVNSGEMVQLNGLDIVLAEAKGTMEGVNVQVGTFLIASEGRILLILGLAQTSADKAEIKGLDMVIGNLRAIAE